MQEYSNEIVPCVEEFIACCHYQCKLMPFEQLVSLYVQLKESFSKERNESQTLNSSLFLQVKVLDSAEAVEDKIHEYFDLNSSSS
jgi:hypothetical protein